MGSALWLGASVMQVYLYSHSGKSMWSRVFHRSCSCRKSGAEVEAQAEEADVLISGHEEGEAESRDQEEGVKEGDQENPRTRVGLMAGAMKVVLCSVPDGLRRVRPGHDCGAAMAVWGQTGAVSCIPSPPLRPASCCLLLATP